MNRLPQRIEEEIGKIVAGDGLELVHIDLKTSGRGYLLRIDIDKEGGVNIDDCSSISQQVSTYLDVEEPIASEYELQVSSPGLDRKFYSDSDYQRFLGKLVRIKTSKSIRGLHVIVGHLSSFDGSKIIVTDPKMKKEKDYEVELKDIKEARLEVEM